VAAVAREDLAAVAAAVLTSAPPQPGHAHVPTTSQDGPADLAGHRRRRRCPHRTTSPLPGDRLRGLRSQAPRRRAARGPGRRHDRPVRRHPRRAPRRAERRRTAAHRPRRLSFTRSVAGPRSPRPPRRAPPPRQPRGWSHALRRRAGAEASPDTLAETPRASSCRASRRRTRCSAWSTPVCPRTASATERPARRAGAGGRHPRDPLRRRRGAQQPARGAHHGSARAWCPGCSAGPACRTSVLLHVAPPRNGCVSLGLSRRPDDRGPDRTGAPRDATREEHRRGRVGAWSASTSSHRCCRPCAGRAAA
jgi:hypothetical protein